MAITQLGIYGDGVDLRLEKRDLAAQLGISRTPLHEAIVRLERDGLVRVVVPNGVFAERESLPDMIVAWAALESMAALWSPNSFRERRWPLRKPMSTNRVGCLTKLSDSPMEVVRSSLLGEHTLEVLSEVLGYSGDDLKRVAASGALGDLKLG